ncbi:unnamed protein product [Heterobilharzia americana]|nr:unnamed protein product [Heterobilharzia americana]
MTMIKVSGNIVLPFVTWAHTPPDHQITSILLSEDGETIATGSADGNIILWSVEDLCSCSPKWMITGHKSLVSNLCIAGRSPISNSQFFFSYSINGEMAVWNWNDGKCLEFKMDTRYRHTYIKSHQTCFLDYRVLFCCGQYAHIVVLHATSLTVLFTLASNSQPDWISSFVVVTHPNKRNEIVLGISFSNVATLWTLDGEEIQGETKYEHESRSINCPSNVLQVDCCPQTPRCILLVCSTAWQLFDAMTCSITCTVSNPSNDILVGGGFIKSNVIGVYGRSGSAYLYCLPKSLIIHSRDSVCSDVPVRITTLSPCLRNNDSVKETVNVNQISTVQNCSCFTPAFIHPKDGFQYLIAGNIHGQLLAWCIKIDSLDYHIQSGLLSENIPTITPVKFSDLQTVWKRYASPNIAAFLTKSITDSDCHSNQSHPKSSFDPTATSTILCKDAVSNKSDDICVTVCIQLTQIICHQRLQDRPTIHPYRLALGLSNGRIVIVRMIDFLNTVYWKNYHKATVDERDELLTQQQYQQLFDQHTGLSKFYLDGHIGAVTSLLHPASYERQFYSHDSNSLNHVNNGDNSADDAAAAATTTTTTTTNITTNHGNSDSGSSNTTTSYHYNPNHLLSGGVDFTVRLWDLNPWHESSNSNKLKSIKRPVGNNSQGRSLCLAVYRCHASPCIGLTIGPPVTSVINMVAGNPRLTSCICSFGADGSVWLFNLKEQRPMLYARNTSSLSSCPVVAIGWRVAEDLLFIAYLDGSVTVWDITMGCLERVETDQSARDLFEQAQFITEVYHPSTFLAFTFSTVSSITMSSYKSRSLAGVPSHNPIFTSLAVPFCGGVNSAYSSGCVSLTAPSRLKYSTIDDIQKLCTNCLPPVQLHLIGSTNSGIQQKVYSEKTMNCGPAAFVFHWDIESLIVEILSQNNAVQKDESISHNNPSLLSYHDDVFTSDVTQANLIQLIISLIHPWGVDSAIDQIIEKFCNYQFIEKDKLESVYDHRHRHQLSRVQQSVCIGLISKCGCMSLSMPGYFSNSIMKRKQKSISLPHTYRLSSVISTNLILCGVALIELMTSLNMKYLLRLSHTIGLTSSSSSLSDSLTNGGDTIATLKSVHINWRTNWLKFGAFLLERFINQLLSEDRNINNNNNITSKGQSYLSLPIELSLFVRKWQDRCLPIRYAARTLLLTCLDRLSLEDRNILVAYWSALLPPFSLTTKDQQQHSRQIIHQQSSLDHTNHVGHITDILANHTELKTARKQSLPQMNGLTNQNSFDSTLLSTEDVIVQTNNGGGDVSNQVSTYTVVSSTSSPSSRHYGSNRQVQTDSLPNITESVSMTSLNSHLNISMVSDSSWWMTLNGYRVSPREHARLQRDIQKCQAIAIVLMGVIGMRFGSRNNDNSNNYDNNSNKKRHPAVVARDLITSPLVITQDRAYSVVNTCDHGLTSPCFIPTDNMDKVSTGISSNHLSLENFSDYTYQCYEIQDGFGLDNHHLARSTCQCLTTLLFNGGYPTLLPTDTNNPEVDWGRLHDQIVGSRIEPLPVYAANALITLLTSNVNSTLRRAGIDLLGRGFPVWEPYVDVGQVINALLLLAADAELLISSDASCQLISDRVDLARTAREALWAIAFARPKLITLALSLEVRRFGSQINAAASAVTSNTSRVSNTSSSQPNLSNPKWGSRSNSLSKDPDNLMHSSRRDSLNAGSELQSSTNMVVMMASPIVAAPVFAPSNTGANVNRSTSGYGGTDSSGSHNPICPPMFKAREEVIRLFEQLCVRRPSDIKDVLPEVVEVILACSDRTRLKERGLDYVFPALTPFSTFSSHTRIQKACTGSVNGSLTFYDFKIGRYFVTMAHKGPVTAVCFHSDGRQVATYSLAESTLRIWQLHTTGFFGMGGQQVKPLSIHPVPPLIPPPTPKLSSSSHKETDHNQTSSLPTTDRLQVWIDWSESRVLHLITNTGIKRRVAL